MVKRKETLMEKLAASSANSITNSSIEDREKQKKLVGIEGWLAFFIGRFVILAALFILGAGYNLIIQQYLNFIILVIPSLINGYAAFSLLTKKKNCVAFAVFASITTLAVGSTIYFLVSRRVKNTYVEKNEKSTRYWTVGKVVGTAILLIIAFFVTLGFLLSFIEDESILNKTITLEPDKDDAIILTEGTYNIELTSTTDVTLAIFATEKDYQLWHTGSDEGVVYPDCSEQRTKAFKQECTVEDGSVLMIYNPAEPLAEVTILLTKRI